MKRKVLLISRRTAKAEALVRCWPEDKWDLYLYTDKRDEWFPGMAEKLGQHWISHHPAKNSGPDSSHLTEVAEKKIGLIGFLKVQKKKIRKYLLLKYIRVYDRHYWSWTLPTYKKLTPLIEDIRPDMVISIYGPLAASLIARKIAVRFGIPWMAYFRDHCTTFDRMVRVPVLWHVQSWIDRWIHGPVISLIGVSSRFIEILNRFYEIPRSESHVITGGFDDRNLPAEARQRSAERRCKHVQVADREDGHSPRVKIHYAGKFYEYRTEPLSILLDAIQILLDKGVPCELKLNISNAFHYFPQKIRQRIDELENKGLHATVRDTEVPYAQALKIFDSADLNIILEGMHPPQSTAGTLTLKIFDLMMIAKPAIAICAPSLPIGKYLRETGIGIDCKDVEQVTNSLDAIWEWKKGGKPPGWYSPNAESIEQYSYSSMAQKMSELCEKVYNRSLHPN
jgi:hypothetical protein